VRHRGRGDDGGGARGRGDVTVADVADAVAAAFAEVFGLAGTVLPAATLRTAATEPTPV
jgi:hypothetical protein